MVATTAADGAERQDEAVLEQVRFLHAPTRENVTTDHSGPTGDAILSADQRPYVINILAMVGATTTAVVDLEVPAADAQLPKIAT